MSTSVTSNLTASSYAPTYTPSSAPTCFGCNVPKCNPNTLESLFTTGGVPIIIGCIIAGIYAYVFYIKSRDVGEPRWGMREMVSEVIEQFFAFSIGFGQVIICGGDKYVPDVENNFMTTVLPLAIIEGVELILFLLSIPFIHDDSSYTNANGTEDGTGEVITAKKQSFERERWEALKGWRMIIMRFLMWSCLGSVFPFFMMLFQQEILSEKHAIVRVIYLGSMSIGLVIGLVGQCVFLCVSRSKCIIQRDKLMIGRGMFLNWVLIKWFVGIIPGTILAIANEKWIILVWGIEILIELNHYFGLYNEA